MKLIFAYIKSFKNYHNQGISFSDDFNVTYNEKTLSIIKKDNDNIKSILFDQNPIKDLHIIVGRTGSGKTNLLQLIGMEELERSFTDNTDAYFLLYKCKSSKDLFAVEICNMQKSLFSSHECRFDNNHTNNRFLFYQFHYNFENKSIEGLEEVNEDMMEDTAIVNTFDKNAFAYYPYHEVNQPKFGSWLPRKITPYDDTFPSKKISALRRYLDLMPIESNKRKAAFIINRINWQHTINVELDKELVDKEYWMYGYRRQGGGNVSLSDLPYNTPSSYNKIFKGYKKTSVKEKFIHDLLTDFAIYLRKIASSVKAVSSQLSYDRPITDLGINPTILPDGQIDIPIDLRITWLGRYIDYHIDEQNGNKGLVWQECEDILALADILNKFSNRFFTMDQFVYPIIKINEYDKRFTKLFEILGQYQRDQYSVFPHILLPYHFSFLSSGEFQLAKVLGAIDEIIVTKIARGITRRKPKVVKNLNLILLMDEPETYLHPEFCRQFIYLITKALTSSHSNLQLQLIITTHSPFMLSDTISSQVTRIDYDKKGECVVLKSSDKPFFAANIFTIMSDGFFLEYTIGEYSREFLTEKYKYLRSLSNKEKPMTSEDKEEIYKIRTILPLIGDIMIRNSFEQLLKSFSIC